MNEQKLREEIMNVFTFGMWHDVPSGYYEKVDRLCEIHLKVIADERARLVEEIEKKTKESKMISEDYFDKIHWNNVGKIDGYNEALQDCINLIKSNEN